MTSPRWTDRAAPQHAQPFPDQRTLHSAVMEAFDSFVPAQQPRNLDEITDRLNSDKMGTQNDTLMMWAIHELVGMTVMQAMGSEIDWSYLRGFDGPLQRLTDAVGLGNTSRLDGLVDAMIANAQQVIEKYRMQQVTNAKASSSLSPNS